MSEIKQAVCDVCSQYGHERSRMMDIVEDIQTRFGGLNSKAIDAIAEALKVPRVEIEGLVTFYSFFSKEKKGQAVIRLCNDVVDNMAGAQDVAQAFFRELGIEPGGSTPDGKISFEYTPCIGMCDQAPAAMVNERIVTNLTPGKAREVAGLVKSGGLPETDVENNIRKAGDVILSGYAQGQGLAKALDISPEQVIGQVKASNLRGRGGAGFPTGMKWEFTRASQDDEKYVLCNADEGEPGTFKDRVLLTEKADMVFEGMTIAAYAIGAKQGILYLRGEYAYLLDKLNSCLEARREQGLLGNNAAGKDGFDFDIRIQLGAGAYVCGEESALISSCEGFRGDPKTKPPFPAQKGYKEKPTTVNNVETFCAVCRILEKGADWYKGFGTEASSGTKLLSICGDCENPGVYEYEFGVTIQQLLDDCGAKNTQAVLVAGPSGQIIAPDQFARKICFSDLATGGAVVIYNQERDLLKIVREYMEFFVEESCGYCTPCRAGNVILKNCLDKIIDGKGEESDIVYLQDLCRTVKATSRCGLGQTSPNSIETTLKNFPGLYEEKLKNNDDGMNPVFDIKQALENAEALQGRKSEIY